MRGVARGRTVRGRVAKGKVGERERLVCKICGKPATDMLDGEPSCADHLELLYENQLEDYTREHQGEHP
jgi:hypothetical protein